MKAQDTITIPKPVNIAILYGCAAYGVYKFSMNVVRGAARAIRSSKTVTTEAP